MEAIFELNGTNYCIANPSTSISSNPIFVINHKVYFIVGIQQLNNKTYKLISFDLDSDMYDLIADIDEKYGNYRNMITDNQYIYLLYEAAGWTNAVRIDQDKNSDIIKINDIEGASVSSFIDWVMQEDGSLVAYSSYGIKPYSIDLSQGSGKAILAPPNEIPIQKKEVNGVYGGLEYSRLKITPRFRLLPDNSTFYIRESQKADEVTGFNKNVVYVERYDFTTEELTTIGKIDVPTADIICITDKYIVLVTGHLEYEFYVMSRLTGEGKFFTESDINVTSSSMDGLKFDLWNVYTNWMQKKQNTWPY